MRWTRNGSLAVICAATLLPAGEAAAEGLRATRIAGFNRPPAKDGYRYPDCFCTDSGGLRVEIGDWACLKIGKRLVMAQCDMSLNNPAWRMEKEDGCPIS